jgi:hypothetical protein
MFVTPLIESDHDNFADWFKQIVHNVAPPESLTGNARMSIQHMDFPDNDKVDFETLLSMYRMYPKLFQPAFALQDALMVHFLGLNWWTMKVQCVR